MLEKDIKVDATYRCKGDWLRTVLQIVPSGTLRSVIYVPARPQGRIQVPHRRNQANLLWFAENAIEEIKHSVTAAKSLVHRITNAEEQAIRTVMSISESAYRRGLREGQRSRQNRPMPIEGVSVFLNESELDEHQQLLWTDLLLRIRDNLKSGKRVMLTREDSLIILAVEALLLRYLPEKSNVSSSPPPVE